MPHAESIVKEMYDWYEDRVDDEELHVVFRHLQNLLFKNVTVQLQEDVWKHPDDGGASQLAAKGEAHLVVSREHVARQVQTVIAWREKWLQDQGLPMNTVIRDDLADSFLDDAKAEFHGSIANRYLSFINRYLSFTNRYLSFINLYLSFTNRYLSFTNRYLSMVPLIKSSSKKETGTLDYVSRIESILGGVGICRS